MNKIEHLLLKSWTGGVPPLEEFGFPWHLSPEFKPAMNGMLAGHWVKAGQFITNMKPPIDFDGLARQHACDLHSWEPVGYALRAHEVFADDRFWQLSLAYVLDWLSRYWKPHADSLDAAHLDALIADGRTFAWYDMAVGRRIFRLAYVLDTVRRDPESDPSLVEELWSALQFHHAILSRDHFFRDHSNHGLYQALGQLAAARRFKSIPVSRGQFALAKQRLKLVLDTHFTEEGAHREHSPGYHYGLMTSFVGLNSAGLLDDQALSRRLSDMEDVLSWMIMPNEHIAPFGDTDPKPMSRMDAFVAQFSSPILQHQMSGGWLGSPPPAGVKALIESGYVFARLYAPGVERKTENVSYLAQIAAFHSRIHKHADHLGFIWYDRGRDVLIDPGRFAYAGRTVKGSSLFNQGFWYSDPKRVYVESTRAHNCVEIDGLSYPRRDVKPFGSALRYAGEQAGLAVSDCQVTHIGSVRHRRVLVMAPGRFLLVLDRLSDTAAEHDYRQWFQFAPEWVAVLADGKLTARAPANRKSPAGALTMVNLIDGNSLNEPVSGQESPELLGWMSDAPYSLIPSTTACVQAPRGAAGRFATLFVLGRSIEADRSFTRLNATLTAGRIAWDGSRGKSKVRFSTDAGSEKIQFVLE